MSSESRSLFNPSFRRQQEEERFQLSAKDYLEKHSIRKYLQDCTALMIESKEESPLDFLATYFQSVATGTNVLFRGFKYVNNTPRNRRSFIRHFSDIFSSFRTTEGLKPETLHQLLCLLCHDFPFSLVRNASRITVDVTETNQTVNFKEFSRKIFILFFFSEFMNQAALAFRTIDSKATGKVNKDVFEEYLRRIVSTKPHVFSCPSVSVITEVFKILGRKNDSTDESIMFNAFCVALFKHPQVELALREAPTYQSLRKDVSHIGKMLQLVERQPSDPT